MLTQLLSAHADQPAGVGEPRGADIGPQLSAHAMAVAGDEALVLRDSEGRELEARRANGIGQGQASVADGRSAIGRAAGLGTGCRTGRWAGVTAPSAGREAIGRWVSPRHGTKRVGRTTIGCR